MILVKELELYKSFFEKQISRTEEVIFESEENRE